MTTKINNFFIACGILLLRAISALPQSWLLVAGRGLGFLLYYLLPKRRNIGILNLRLCFPEKNERELRRLIKEHFQELCIISFSYGLIFGASPQRLRHLIRYRNVKYLQAHYEKHPVILLAPHFLALDIGANRTSLDFIGYSIFANQRSQYLSHRVKQARLRFIGQRGGEIFSRQQGLRSIVKKMKQHNWPFYYLPDQDMDEKNSVYVPFFAHPHCATLDTLPKLYQLANAVVIPMATYREGKHYVVEFFPGWDNYPSGDVVADVSYMNRFIEQMILRHPAQYLWLHKRFKTQPNLPRGKLYENC